MKIRDFSSEDLSNPESFFNESFSSFDGDELFIFSKEKSKTSGNISAIGW